MKYFNFLLTHQYLFVVRWTNHKLWRRKRRVSIKCMYRPTWKIYMQV